MDFNAGLNRQNRAICEQCINEPHLSKAIEKNGSSASCFYCNREGKTWNLGKLAEEVHLGIQHAYRIADQKLQSAESKQLLDSKTVNRLNPLASANSVNTFLQHELRIANGGACLDLGAVLTQVYDIPTDSGINWYQEGTRYELKSDFDLFSGFHWWDMEEELHHTSRFFSRRPAQLVNELFGDLKEQIQQHPQVVKVVQQNDPIYRGRFDLLPVNRTI